MMGFLQFLGLKNIVILIGVSFLGLVIWSYQADKHRLMELEQTLVSKEAEIYLLKRSAEQKQKALDAAEVVRKELDKYKKTYSGIYTDMKGKQDGEIAPVLRDTLDSIGRLQSHEN